MTSHNKAIKRPGLIALFCIAAPGIAAAADAPRAASADPVLSDIAMELQFQDRFGHGRGQVAADFNGDGWTDFYIGNTSDANLGNDESFIVWNFGPDTDGSFRFEKGPVLVQGVAAFGASGADYDGDGDTDLFIAVGGQETVGLDFLFRNDGDGSFTDVSEAAGVRGPRNATDAWVPTASLAGHWMDYDRDGDLDLFVASKIVGNPSLDPLRYRDSLFRNDGDGSFTDVTENAGLTAGASTKHPSLGDYDNDGWMDIFLPIEEYQGGFPHDFMMMRNNRDGTFVEVPLDENALGVGTRSWASANADFNNDGLLDILVFARRRGPGTDSHVLLVNQGDWTFTNEAFSSGLAAPGVPAPNVMGCQIGDLNNDGYPDVIMANGGPTSGDTDILLMNEYAANGEVVFRDASSLFDYPAPEDPDCVATPLRTREGVSYIDHGDMAPSSAKNPHAIRSDAVAQGGNVCNPTFPYRGHAITFTDFDKDGDVDLPMIKGGTEIIAPTLDSREPNRFFRNDGGNALNWLYVTLHGTVSNQHGIGARVEVITSSDARGTHSVFDDARAGRCFASSGPRELHFGLGTDTVVQAVRVWWPSGIRTVMRNPPINKRLRIQESVLEQSDFNDGAAPGWTAQTGTWNVDGDTYAQSASSGAARAVGGQDRSDYSVIGKLTYRFGQKNIGLLGRVSADGEDYYAAVLSATSARLHKSVGGVLTPIGEPIGIDEMTPGKSYIVSLKFQGPLISMSVGTTSTAPVSDETFASGRIGLATVNTGATFDNIAVY